MSDVAAALCMGLADSLLKNPSAIQQHDFHCDLCGGTYTGTWVEHAKISHSQIFSVSPDKVTVDTTREAVLADVQARDELYGDFGTTAAISQGLKAICHKAPSWDRMDPGQREAMEMIMWKAARILNGDPNYSDSWYDIAGYATLEVDRQAHRKKR